MFRPKPHPATPPADHTRALRDPQFYRPGHLRSLGLQGDLSALAYDPLLGLLAAGTTSGLVHLSGSPAFSCTVPLYPAHAAGTTTAATAQARHAAQAGCKFVAFHPGERLVVVDTQNTIHVWTLAQGGMDDVKGTPRKTACVSLYGDVTYLEQPTVASAHVGVAFRDGNLVWFDLERGVVAPYK